MSLRDGSVIQYAVERAVILCGCSNLSVQLNINQKKTTKPIGSLYLSYRVSFVDNETNEKGILAVVRYRTLMFLMVISKDYQEQTLRFVSLH